MAKLTVYGIERYLNSQDRSLFSEVVFPEGIDKDTAVNEIILRSNDFEVIYSDADFLAEAITHWSKKYALTFAKWVEGFEAEFSPIDNYDRIEEWEDHEGNSNKTDYGRKDTTTFGRKDTTTFGRKDTTTFGKKDTTTNGKTETITHAKTDTHEVSAYNASTYQAKDKNTEGGTTTTALSGTDSVQASGSDSLQLSGSDSIQLSGSDSIQLSGSDTVTGKINSSHKGRVHGNIGVMTTTDILAGWTDFYGRYNLYELIADLFCAEFCIMVY